MWGLERAKVQRALLILALAESPVVLQLLDLDRSYLFFAFGLAWAVALYGLIDPKPRAIAVGLGVYLATAVTALPLLVLWMNAVPGLGHFAPAGLGRQLLGSFGVGLREEVSKSTALVAILWIGLRLGQPFSSREGMIYGAMSGLAFSAVENLETFHKMGHLDQLTAAHGLDAAMAWTVAAALSRLVLTPLAHACWSATVGFGFTAPARSGGQRLALGAGAFVLVSALHGLYDTCATLGNRLGVGALLALSFLLLLFLISRGEQIEVPAADRRHERLVVPAPLGARRLALPVALAAGVLALVGWSLLHYGLAPGV